jgi:hypothetical protein
MFHVSQSQIQNYLTTDGQLASLFWCQAAPGAQDEIFITDSCGFVRTGRPL